MKKLVILLLLAFNFNLFAQSGINSTINSVTVFKQNAEITRIVNTKLIAGTQEIVLNGISTSINPSSLQVEVNNDDITLLSAKYELNYLKTNTNNPEIKKLKEQLTNLDDELYVLTDQRESLNGMQDILNKNQAFGESKNGFTPSQVIELSNAYRAKSLEIRAELRTIKKQEKEILKQKTKIQNQLNEKNASFNKPTGNIILKIASKTPINTNLKCTYIVNNAGWNPLYDLRSSGITKNVQLNYKANVYQNTGLNWSNVIMVVSTGNPMQNNNRPILSPLYSQIYSNRYYENEDTLNEVVIVAQGRKKEKRALGYGISNMMEGVAIDKKEKDGFNYNASVTTNQINIEFKIANTQSIKSDGKENLIALKNYDLETKYMYHAVPKLSTNAFLLAKVKDWGKYNLENGEANIFFEGAYIGKTYINSQVTTDTLLISMGRDNGIQVTRKPIKEYQSSKFIGSNKKETFGYDILVKNKKTIPIEIEILDQIPVSQNKLISVELLENSNANYDKEIGKLLWKLKLQPQETVKKRLVYSVKYPKKESVTNMK